MNHKRDVLAVAGVWGVLALGIFAPAAFLLTLIAILLAAISFGVYMSAATGK